MFLFHSFMYTNFNAIHIEERRYLSTRRAVVCLK